MRATYDVEAKRLYVYTDVEDTEWFSSDSVVGRNIRIVATEEEQKEALKDQPIDAPIIDYNKAGEVIGFEFLNVELDTAP